MRDSLTLTNENGNFAINYNVVTPTGMIICFAGELVPPGWVLCDGSEISKSEYSTLFSIIGNTYGTPVNSSNFILPNLQQKIPLGKSNSNNLGDKGGNSEITLSTNQLPSHDHTGTTTTAGLHTHTALDSGHNHSYEDAYFAENRAPPAEGFYGTGSDTDNDNNYIYRSPTPTTFNGYANITVSNNGEHTHTFTTDARGSNSSINIMNPYLVLNYLIKY
jgi:microcystin-dependent protein